MPNVTLYKFDSCPFCVMVMRHLEANGIDIPMRDISQEQGAREELMAIGGKTQVPCLVIDGKPLYESRDIIAWFDANWTQS